MTVNNPASPQAELRRLGDAIARYVEGPLDLVRLAQRCRSYDAGLNDVMSWWPGVEPEAVLWLRNVRLATLSLTAASDGWVACVSEVAPVRPDTARRPLDAVLDDVRVEWAPAGGVRFGSMIIDPQMAEVRLGDVQVKLTPRQWECLRVLASTPGRWLMSPDVAKRIPETRDPEDVSESIRALRRRLQYSGFNGWVHSQKRLGHRFCPPGWPIWPDLEAGAIRIDVAEKRVQVGGREVVLGPRRFELACIHVAEPEREFAPAELLERLPGLNTESALRKRERALTKALGMRFTTWDSKRQVYRTLHGSEMEET